MKLIIISSGDFFSNYGGGQVYCRNLVEMLSDKSSYKYFRQQYFQKDVDELDIMVLSHASEKLEKNAIYLGCKIRYYSDATSIDNLKAIVKQFQPDEVHINGDKAKWVRICHDLAIHCRVTAHHGGIVCPAGTLLNSYDKICNCKSCHTNCLRCVLHNTFGGRFVYPFMKWMPKQWYLKLGETFSRLHPIFCITPIACAAQSIELKQQDWNTIKQYADEVIAPSYAMGEALVRNGLSKNKLSVLPHSIPKRGYPLAKPHAGIVRFYYIGRINHNKGIHVMLEAFSKIEANVELHLIGTCGSSRHERHYMSSLQHKYKSHSNIIWHGQKTETESIQLIANYDVMIHPAICLEVFGLSIAEALAMGKFVIATKCGGAEMQIKEGINGTLVPTNDASSLQAAISTYAYKILKRKQ